jgi:predicted S18 family serine protease
LKHLKKKGVDVRDLLVLNNELYITLEDELTTKEPKKKAQEKKKYLQKKQMLKKSSRRNKVISDAMLQQEKSIQAAKLNIAEQRYSINSSVFVKSKAIQKQLS